MTSHIPHIMSIAAITTPFDPNNNQEEYTTFHDMINQLSHSKLVHTANPTDITTTTMTKELDNKLQKWQQKNQEDDNNKETYSFSHLILKKNSQATRDEDLTCLNQINSYVKSLALSHSINLPLPDQQMFSDEVDDQAKIILCRQYITQIFEYIIQENLQLKEENKNATKRVEDLQQKLEKKHFPKNINHQKTKRTTNLRLYELNNPNRVTAISYLTPACTVVTNGCVRKFTQRKTRTDVRNKFAKAKHEFS